MTYFPKDIFQHILSFCDTRIKEDYNRVVADIHFLNNKENKSKYSNCYWTEDDPENPTDLWDAMDMCFNQEQDDLISIYWYNRSVYCLKSFKPKSISYIEMGTYVIRVETIKISHGGEIVGFTQNGLPIGVPNFLYHKTYSSLPVLPTAA